MSFRNVVYWCRCSFPTAFIAIECYRTREVSRTMQSIETGKPDKSIPRLRPEQAAAIAALVTLAVASYFYWGKFQGNITGFFRIGDVLPFSPYLDASKAMIATGELGYDGQQFLTLAFDPWVRNPLTLEALDNPVYRYSRILYPLLGHGLALGRPALIPYSLVLINLVCLPLMVWRMAWGLGNECRQWAA